ncbi:MAG: hypothetical protein GX536_03755 [Actinobacteria bacterium]|nr:hypothetical protein [Actinomycetota bacterium]
MKTAVPAHSFTPDPHPAGSGKAPPRLLVLEHGTIEQLGTLEEPLGARTAIRHLVAYRDPVHYARPVDSVVRAHDFDGLVVLGGPATLVDKHLHPFLDESLRIVRLALRSDTPILGIGLGAHLVAWSLGARVWAGRTRGKGGEYGWYPVSLTDRGKVDPVFHGFREIDSVFHWHGDSFDLPAKAWGLAETHLYAQQAFRWGRWVYGLQFHVEVTGQMVADWVDTFGDDLAFSRRVDPDIMVAKAVRYCPTLKLRAETLAKHFADCVQHACTERKHGQRGGMAGVPAGFFGSPAGPDSKPSRPCADSRTR